MSNRMPGHWLESEGAPHDKKGRRLGSLWGYSTSGDGYGKCSCGKLSPLLPSGMARKKWHREHKEALRKESKR